MESKTVNENFPEEFRNDEEFGYMAGYELWKKLIFADNIEKNVTLLHIHYCTFTITDEFEQSYDRLFNQE